MVVAAFDSVGKWLAIQAGGAKVFSVVFRLLMGVYLFISAALGIRMFTGLPVFVVVIAWLVLTTELPRRGRPMCAILPPSARDALTCTLLLLGSAYRLAGHASGAAVLVIAAYWALVLLARPRRA
ncbi:hypothetical protein AB4Y45_35070 [Paraburkholderia sp. EG287A]|uniref:hypothetical protein n=1 Tax=Paraburkholderia sp. EG287A TaxID=3237012 RepID=UPI0034D2DADA